MGLIYLLPYITLSFGYKTEELSLWLMFWTFPIIPTVSVTVTFRGYFFPFFRWKDAVRNLNPSALSLETETVTVPENLWVEKPGTMGNVQDVS
jgi:hypothetical protein